MSHTHLLSTRVVYTRILAYRVSASNVRTVSLVGIRRAMHAPRSEMHAACAPLGLGFFFNCKINYYSRSVRCNMWAYIIRAHCLRQCVLMSRHQQRIVPRADSLELVSAPDQKQSITVHHEEWTPSCMSRTV